MPSEFSPPGGKPRMTKTQMQKYLADLHAAQEAAKKKLEAEEGKEQKEREKEVAKLEDKLDDVFYTSDSEEDQVNIYVAHSQGFDYKNGLYLPIRQSNLDSKYKFTLPHEFSDLPFDSLSFFRENADLVVAEISYPSTGLGIELGWAYSMGIPIIAIYKSNSNISKSVSAATDIFIEYTDSNNLIDELNQKLDAIF